MFFDKYKIYEQILPQDLLKFGLIPEFVGRLPIITTLKELDRESLIRIITEPKNALVKQYQKLLEMDGVKLDFEPAAIDYIAKEAIKRKTGARALRSIVEEIMLDVMYEIPTQPEVKEFTITEKMVQKTENLAELIKLPSKKKDENEEEIA